MTEVNKRLFGSDPDQAKNLIGFGSYTAGSNRFSDILLPEPEFHKGLSATYERIVEWSPMLQGGTIRVYWDTGHDGVGTNKTRVYINDVGVGIERSGPKDSWSQVYSDVDVVPGDRVAIWAHKGTCTNSWVRNAYIASDRAPVPVEVYNITSP